MHHPENVKTLDAPAEFAEAAAADGRIARGAIIDVLRRHPGDNGQSLPEQVIDLIGRAKDGMTAAELNIAIPGKRKPLTSAVHKLLRFGKIIRDGQRKSSASGRDCSVYRAAPTGSGPQFSVQVRGIAVPDGRTLSDILREGMELQEREGLGRNVVARQLRIGLDSYREGTSILKVAGRAELSPKDAELVKRACSLMDETRTTFQAFEMIQPLLKQIWGSSRGVPRTDRAAKKQVDRFLTAVAIAVQACANMRDLPIPMLSASDTKQAQDQLRESIATLKGVSTRLRRERGHEEG